MIGVQDYRDSRFPIIGIHAMDDQMRCTCGIDDCQAAGKHPVMSCWQLGIQWDDEQIATMKMAGHLTAFGVLTDGFLIVDVDPRNGGGEGYDALCKCIDLELQDEAGFVVSTGGGGKHIYFKIPAGMKLKAHDKRFQGIDFKSSGFVIGCGSFHKSGNFYSCDTGSPAEITEIPAALVEALKFDEKSDRKFSSENFTDYELAEMLEFIPNSVADYDKWIAVGMAIHKETAGNGFTLWENWSSKFDGYDPATLNYKWASFGKYGGREVTAGTLHMMAAECGWSRSVTFEATEADIERLKEVERQMSLGVGDCPVEYAHIDVRHPPGIVGQLTAWINQQCADERKYLAALAALYATSIIAGASCEIYLTPRKATPNLFCIGLAGSGSGKGDVLSALQKIIDCSGLNRTVAGKIRSERFIYDALCNNQMLNLVMDEIGIKLSSVIGKKVADHNMDTAAAIMEAYTSDVLYCDPRVADEAKNAFIKRLNAIMQAIDENESDADRQDVECQFREVIERIDGAIKDPFFSIFGLSTDDQFKKLITEENIKSGMMGRTIIMQELEAIAEENQRVNYCDIPLHLKMKIKNIVSNGTTWNCNYTSSIIFNKQKIKITSAPDVQKKSVEFQRWLKLVSRQHVENGTGYEPLISRCAVKVAKIAGILACDTGTITMEHLSYAVALTIRSTHDLMMRADSLAGANSKNQEARKEGLEAMVKEHVSRMKTKTAIIKDVSKEGNYRRRDVESMIEILLDSKIIAVDGDAPRTAKNAIIYCLVDDEARL